MHLNLDLLFIGMIYKKKGNKKIKCPVCWSFEISRNEIGHYCENCGELYCQKYLKYLGEREHNHPLENFCEEGCLIRCVNCYSICWEEICDLIDLLLKYYKKDLKCWQIFLLIILFVFGTPKMFTIKYLIFFCYNI